MAIFSAPQALMTDLGLIGNNKGKTFCQQCGIEAREIAQRSGSCAF